MRGLVVTIFGYGHCFWSSLSLSPPISLDGLVFLCVSYYAREKECDTGYACLARPPVRSSRVQQPCRWWWCW
ncbi:hypothetical protein B0H66DRAFT_541747 [Apodospora peruviana]|uniref:Uncharacterized protein n=1 Tax=Apodospora peruviana TaxID=516989 RepID=A0AAE0IR29_9PEZI|nr:hypothetical protein B0H66DRAFT_541747 [Apodospora peruviana]